MSPALHNRESRPRPRAGFTLLEMIVVLALMAVLTGALVPSVTTMVASKARRVTLGELEELGRASLEHFRDVWSLPASPNLLLSSAAVGWAGPYLSGALDDSISGGSGYLVDAWSRPYTFSVAGNLLTLRSRGLDGVLNSSDDLVLVVNATPIRREETLRRLAIINVAILHYNATYLTTNPLPANWSTIYSRLVTTGFLPSGGGLDVDGWGVAFVPDPAAATPVVKVTSSSL
jgi:prepilin-type N-terminal cleavage/methylation domain-containing protein